MDGDIQSDTFLFKKVFVAFPKRENYELRGYGTSLLNVEGVPCFVYLYSDGVPFILPKGGVKFHQPDGIVAEIRKMKLAWLQK